MKTYNDNLILQFDEIARGNAASGELVTVFDAGLATKPAIFDVFGSPIANPLTTDAKGNYTFQVADGIYDVVGKAGTPDETRRDRVEIIELDDKTPVEVDDVVNLRLTEPTNDGQQIKLLGHTIAGVGSGIFYFDASDTTSADNSGTVIVTTGGARWKRTDSDISNIYEFGAIDGTDSTAAIDAAILYAFGDEDFPRQLYFGTGDFTYGGTGFVKASGDGQAATFVIQGDGSGLCSITCTSDVHFIETNAIFSCDFKGFTFKEGKSFIINNNTGANVFDKYLVDDVILKDQTVVCIGSDASDMPSWKITNSNFSPITQSTLALALNGLLDECSFKDSNFSGILKLAWGANNATLKGCFFPYPDVEDGFNVWLVPRDQEINSGQNFVIENNKFGPESATPPVLMTRVLVADETVTTGVFYEQPTPDRSPSTNFIALPKFRNNLFGGRSESTDSSILEIWCNNSARLDFGYSEFPTTKPVTMVKIGSGVTLAGTPFTTSNQITYHADSEGVIPCNIPNFAKVVDPFNTSGVQKGIDQFATTNSTYLELRATNGAGRNGLTSGSAAVATGEFGGATSEFTFTASDGAVIWTADTSSSVIDFEKPLFVAISLKKGTTNPLLQVTATVSSRTSGGSLTELETKNVILTDDYERVSFKTTLQKISTGGVALSIRIVDFVGASQETLIVDQILIWQGDKKVESGHIVNRGFDAGDFDAAHIIIGDLHLFRNGNDLRLSIGEPTSSTDGTLLGTAT